MNAFINANMKNNVRTINGMATNSSSGDPILDLFFLCGATRNMPDDDIISVFNEAYEKDSTSALRILFYARDIEKGLGERRFFRIVAKWLNKGIMKSILQDQNFTQNIVRVDDLVYLADYFIQNKNYDSANAIIKFLFDLMKNKSLQGIVAKWMPRKNSQYGQVVKYMRSNGFIDSYSSYRHQIVNLTNVVEQSMSAKEWDKINLEHVPSIAMKKYKKAFHRHNILKPFVDRVVAGEAKVHAKRLFPYDIVKEILNNRIYCLETNNTNRQLLNEQWKGLQQLDDLPKEFRAIPVIDVSGSMTSPANTPISIALGIGIFMAENNPNEEFRNYFVTFSESPKFQKIFGVDITEKVKNALSADWGMNTNLEAVFELILAKAVDSKVPENEMPTTIVIISDMEFDQCSKTPSHNALEMIKSEYANAGYTMPAVVFWNVNGRLKNLPAQMNDKDVLLVSGASQNAINFVLKKGYEDLMQLVLEITENPRYQHIID